MIWSKRKTSKLFSLLAVAFAILVCGGSQLNAAAGDIKWQNTIKSHDKFNPVVFGPFGFSLGHNGTIYGYLDEEAFAFNPDGSIADGSEERLAMSEFFYACSKAPVIATDGTLYYHYKGGVLAVDPNSYSVKWDVLDGYDVNDIAFGPDGELFCGDLSGRLVALNRNGGIIWASTENYGAIASIAVDSYGTIWVASAAGLSMVYPNGVRKLLISRYGAFSIADWAGTYGTTMSIDAQGTVYVTNGKMIYATNPDGTEKWALTLNTDGSLFHDNAIAPSIGSDGTLYVGHYGGLSAINPDGTLKWRRTYEDHGKPYDVSQPAIGSDGTIYVCRQRYSNKDITAVNPADGSVKWEKRLQSSITGIRPGCPLLGEDGTLYSISYDTFYAIDTGTNAGLADSPWPREKQNNQNMIALDPYVRMNPFSGTFGLVQQSINRTLNFTNRHSSELNVSVNSDNTFFTVGSPSFTIAPGETREVTVSFTATQESTWQVESCDISVKLTGDNIPADMQPYSYLVRSSAGEITLSKNGFVAPPGMTDSVRITNNSLMDIAFNSLLPGTTFTISPDTFAVAAGASQIVTVTNNDPSAFFKFHEFKFGVTGAYIPERYSSVSIPAINADAFSGGDMLPAPAVFVSSTGNETFTETSGAYELWVKLNEELESPEVRILISEDGGESYDDTLYCQPKEDNVYAATVAAREMGSSFAYRFEATNSEFSPYIFNLPKRWDRTYAIDVSTVKRGDIDGDWSVNVTDLLGFLQEFKAGSGTDVNSDGKVNIFDLLEILRLMKNR